MMPLCARRYCAHAWIRCLWRWRLWHLSSSSTQKTSSHMTLLYISSPAGGKRLMPTCDTCLSLSNDVYSRLITGHWCRSVVDDCESVTYSWRLSCLIAACTSLDWRSDNCTAHSLGQWDAAHTTDRHRSLQCYSSHQDVHSLKQLYHCVPAMRWIKRTLVKVQVEVWVLVLILWIQQRFTILEVAATDGSTSCQETFSTRDQ